ncbi:hypothetical protein C8R41DRAFT_923308 [Lentinula lateritia]|uniref:Uncharacterized protein n=1 Tax=Lentinula lateritia TaxID=40482 RepID=A0ABQ8VBV9_9AGAR|nr:hypothetical protein C8R41DRAFT_923308 [Lentinula lateritia]
MPVNHKYTLSTSNNTTFLDISTGHALDLFTHIFGLISSLFAILVPSTTLLDSNSNSTNKIVLRLPFHVQSASKQTEFNWIIQEEPEGTLRIFDDSDRTT